MADDPADVAFLGVVRQRRLLAEGGLSARQLVSLCLERIEAQDRQLHAFVSVRGAAALEEADRVQRALDDGTAGPLAGIPFAVKDEHDLAGHVTSYGTRARATVAKEDSGLVRALRSAGAIPVGKTAMPELGMHPFTESAWWGVTRNPWDPSRTPGGSSGGSAAAVAAGLVPFATAGDGGGSIRIPGSCCNLFGLKVQRGRIADDAAPPGTAMANLTVPGVLTRRVDDAAALYDVLAPGAPGWGRGLGDAARRAPGRLRIGVAATLGSPARVDGEVRAVVAQVGEVLGTLGHEIIPVTVRPGRWEVPFSIIGLRVLHEQARVVEDPTVLEGRTRAAMRLAARVPDRLGRWAVTRQQRTQAVGRMFDGVDLILTPTLSAPPPPVGKWEGRGLMRTSFGVIRLCPFTSLGNYLGLPAATIPAGFTAAGLPVGAQLLGPADGEPALVAVAAQLEAELGWLARRPPVGGGEATPARR